jgi:hypothetical protein
MFKVKAEMLLLKGYHSCPVQFFELPGHQSNYGLLGGQN